MKLFWRKTAKKILIIPIIVGNGTNTGDSAHILLWLTLLTASLLGAIAVVLSRRKKLN